MKKKTTNTAATSTQAHVTPAAAKATTKATRPKKAAQKPTRAAAKATGKKAAPASRDGSKKAAVLALISRKNGATLEEIMTATSWQKHTIRGFISILNKGGTKIESRKSEAGARTYTAA